MSEYESLSKAFLKAWNQGEEIAHKINELVPDMLAALQADGYSRSAAINKVIADHKQLKGFSHRTIYRYLPAEEKRLYLTQPKPEKLKKSNVPNGTIYTSDTRTETEPEPEGTIVHPPLGEIPDLQSINESPDITTEVTQEQPSGWIRLDLVKFGRERIMNFYNNGGHCYVWVEAGDIKKMISAMEYRKIAMEVRNK